MVTYYKQQFKKGLRCDETPQYKTVLGQGENCAQECREDKNKSKPWKKAGCDNEKLLLSVDNIGKLLGKKDDINGELKRTSFNNKKYNQLNKKITTIDNELRELNKKVKLIK